MAGQRRSYTREFKVEAVKLVTQKGYLPFYLLSFPSLGVCTARSFTKEAASESLFSLPCARNQRKPLSSG
jgi:hypothetical protein